MRLKALSITTAERSLALSMALKILMVKIETTLQKLAKRMLNLKAVAMFSCKNTSIKCKSGMPQA